MPLQTRHCEDEGSICAVAGCHYRHDIVRMRDRSVRWLGAITDMTL